MHNHLLGNGGGHHAGLPLRVPILVVIVTNLECKVDVVALIAGEPDESVGSVDAEDDFKRLTVAALEAG